MDGVLHMEFQLSQARLRAVIGTLSTVCIVAIPCFGYLADRYVSNLDDASMAIGRLTTEMAVLTTQTTYLREDIQDLRHTVKSLQDRTTSAVFMTEVKDAEADVSSGARSGAESYYGQAWSAGIGGYGLPYPERG